MGTRSRIRKVTRTLKLTGVKRSGNKVTPQLRMSGRCLEENGFKVNEMVEIIVREDLLIIQPLISV